MTQGSVKHATFKIERSYAASPGQVFAAWAEPKAKRAWFAAADEGWEDVEHAMDFRVGGRERTTGRQPGGPLHVCTSVYQDIAAEKRIVWTYVMTLDDTPASISLATVEFLPSGRDTQVIYTEQGCFLGRLDGVKLREAGCGWLMNKLGDYLAAVSAGT